MILRDYQNEISDQAVKLLNNYKIAYLSMQVRTGKTLTALETARKYKANKVLFITKKKAITSIVNDYLNNYYDYYQIHVTNYESIHKLIDIFYDLIIIDEAHSLGQFPTPSKRTKDLKLICNNKPIIYLSGTPSPESYSQLFHQFWISSFSPFGHSNFYQWAKSGYVTIKTKHLYNLTIPDYSQANKEMINDKIQHLFLSYTQEQAGFEQIVNEQIHLVDMDEKTYKAAKKLRQDKVLIKQDGNVIEADTPVKLMNKLHQIYSGSVINDTDGSYTIFDESKAKFIFDKWQFCKKAIFYKFKAEREIIIKNAIIFDYNYTEDSDVFNNSDINTIFISQIQSGREGINLSSADILIMYNIDFSAVSYWQARARMQTKNREKPAEVHWIFSRDGIEQRIYNAVSNKKNYTLSYFKKEEKL